MSSPSPKSFHALIEYEDPYAQPLILSALRSRLPYHSYELISSSAEHSYPDVPLLQWRAYEFLDFDLALSSPSTCLINSYIIRKALIRKHYLSTTISNWIIKHPDSVLGRHFKPAVEFELDYAEFLDDALTEADAFDLRTSMDANSEREESKREWWILKPGMSDRGQGIQLFSTEEQLTAIFEKWEAERSDSDEDNDHDGVVPADNETEESGHGIRLIENANEEKDYIITSQLRHFIAQPYIHLPLLFPRSLFPSAADRKFHIRAYVLAVGALQVYIYRPMLALFSAEPYRAPHEATDPNQELQRHLTNTCLQGSGEREGSVHLFRDLPSSTTPGLNPEWKDAVFAQVCTVTGEAFEAAARGMSVHFQPLPSAFEIFGVDFLVDGQGTAWLLEMNAFPDFRQTGEELKGVVEGLFEEVVEVAVRPYFGIQEVGGQVRGEERLTKVLDIDLGRR